MKLSYSKLTLYKECPKKFEYVYINKLRNKVLSSALFLGSAIDEALNALLLTKKKKLNKTEKDIITKGELNIFKEYMVNIYNEELSFFKKDFEIDLLPKEIKLKYQNYNINELIDLANKNFKELSKEQYEVYKEIMWHCVYAKGIEMIKAYKRDIYPQIEEVFYIQKKISIKNDKKDEITGIIDFCAKFFGDDNIYICDNKTSSSLYTQTHLDNSQQLATYVTFAGLINAAYVVLNKKIYKKDPKFRTQIIKGALTEELIDATFNEYENLLTKIENNEFPKNFANKCFSYGAVCEFFDLCHKNKTIEQYKKEQKIKRS